MMERSGAHRQGVAHAPAIARSNARRRRRAGTSLRGLP